MCAVYLELSHEWSGVFYALSNMLATVPGIVAPIATAGLLRGLGAFRGWVAAFAIGLGLGTAAACLFFRQFHGVDLRPLPEIDGAPDDGGADDPLAAPLLAVGDAGRAPSYAD